MGALNKSQQRPSSSGGTRGHGFGTAPVFLASISTILGAILFLRFGYAVGHVGMLGALLIVLIAHAITIPTGLAVAEIESAESGELRLVDDQGPPLQLRELPYSLDTDPTVS